MISVSNPTERISVGEAEAEAHRGHVGTCIIADRMPLWSKVQDQTFGPEILLVTAASTEEAISILQKKQINLVMTDMNFPNLSGLEFVKIIEKETRLPIVLMCDPSDQQLVMDGLTNAPAILGFTKPLCHHDIKSLWQLPILKRREVLLGSRQPLIPLNPEIPESSGSQSKRRKMEQEMEISCRVSIGRMQPPSSVNLQASSSTAPHLPLRTNNSGAMYRHGHNPLTNLMRHPHSRGDLKTIVMGARRRWEAQHGVGVSITPDVRTLNFSARVQRHAHQPLIPAPRIVIGPQPRQGSQHEISVNITSGRAQLGVSTSISPGVGALNISAPVPSAPQQQFRPMIHGGSTRGTGGDYEISAAEMLEAVWRLCWSCLLVEKPVLPAPWIVIGPRDRRGHLILRHLKKVYLWIVFIGNLERFLLHKIIADFWWSFPAFSRSENLTVLKMLALEYKVSSFEDDSGIFIYGAKCVIKHLFRHINAQEAICILRTKDVSINVVLTSMNFPNLSGLEFVKIIEKETRLPIVLMCDPSDQQMVMDGLTSGAAMLGLTKPLCHHDIKNLWQLPILKKREVLLGSRHPLIPLNPEIPESSGSQSKRRKMEEEMEISCHVSIGRIQPPSTVNLHASSSTASHLPLRTNNHGAMYWYGHNPLTNLMRHPHSRGELKTIVMGARRRWEAQHGVGVSITPGYRALNFTARVQGHPHQPLIPAPSIVIGPQPRQGSQHGISVNITSGRAQHGVSISICSGVGTLNNSVPSAPQQQFLPMLVPVALATKIEHFVYALLNANYAHPGSMMAVPGVPGGDNEISAAYILEAVLELLAG